MGKGLRNKIGLGMIIGGLIFTAGTSKIVYDAFFREDNNYIEIVKLESEYENPNKYKISELREEMETLELSYENPNQDKINELRKERSDYNRKSAWAFGATLFSMIPLYFGAGYFCRRKDEKDCEESKLSQA